MNKNTKIIIIGFGSIGRRHYDNLSRLGFKNLSVYDIDKSKLKAEKLKKINDIKIETLKRFNVAFICQPNNFHIKTAVLCAKAGCHLFIEKPLSHNLKNFNNLLFLCRQKKLVTMVGCNMRFHPCLEFIKKYLAEKKLGKTYSLDHEFGYYLPYWRPGHDYRKNYAAKKSTGGGIILDDIHEFDLLFWLNDFAPVSDFKFICDKVSRLQIETEDICLAIFKFKNKVFGSVRCDYLQQDYSRHCKIACEKGNLRWDFKENIVWLSDHDENRELFSVKDFDFNETYIQEIKYFFACVDKKQKTFNDIAVAYNVLKFCVNR